jgi:uncharacterized metal-binding protein YceD (DUF177 family)
METTIPFRGLKQGKHVYNFKIGNTFFEQFPDSEIREGALIAEVTLSRRSSGLEAHFNIQGNVKVTCDRCLDEFYYPVAYNGNLFFEFGDESREVTDELIILSESDNYLDLGKYIFEFINLSLPLQKFHPNDENGKSLCNSEMLDKLEKHRAKNSNNEIVDPRWDKLRDLMN